MNTINNQEQTIIVPLGKALQAARLAASLSIEEVAEQLNLGVTTLRDIEDDLDDTIANQKYAVIYLRGYLSNYAKLVKLDKLTQFIEYQQLAQSEKKSANLRAPMILPPPVKKRSKLLLISLFILLGVAALYLLMTQQDFSDAPEPLNSDRTEVEINSDSLSSDSDVINRELELFDSENDYSDSGVGAGSVNEQSSVSEQISDSNDALENTDVALLAEQENAAAEEPITDNQVVADAALPSTEVTAEDAQLSAQNAPVVESLQLSFSANCWTEIFDATGKRLAFDLYKAGDSLTVDGVAPFELKLGDPSGVQIQYQGKRVSREFVLGHTARFHIPQ